MTAFAVIAVSGLAVILIAQILLAAGFMRRLRRDEPGLSHDAGLPKVAVILSVRGDDPTLADCALGLMNQAYPDYDVRIIVDSREDPAWPVMTGILERAGRAGTVMQPLEDPRATCSLKCSSLIQAVSDLDPAYDVIALADTDVVPGRDWLRNLVAPLRDPGVGATSGNRWFAADGHAWGSLIRYAWNAAAVVLMYWLRVAWGGSLAIKRSVLEKGGVVDLWSRAFTEDTSLDRALRNLGLRLEFVPAAIMVDSRDCSVSAFTDWATRQLLCCRLHHSGWWGVLTHGLGTSLLPGLSCVLLIFALASGELKAGSLIAGSLAAYLLTLLVLLILLEFSVRSVLASGAPGTFGATIAGKLIIAIPLAQLLYGYCLLLAWTSKMVSWRGVHYRILEGKRVRLVSYKPFSRQEIPEPPDSVTR